MKKMYRATYDFPLANGEDMSHHEEFEAQNDDEAMRVAQEKPEQSGKEKSFGDGTRTCCPDSTRCRVSPNCRSATNRRRCVPA